MSEQAQVGDMVRLTIEGKVYAGDTGRLYVLGWCLNRCDDLVEILSRAIPPLPSEPGTWWLDVGGFVWIVTSTGVLFRPGAHTAAPQTYAPFRQLVLK